MQTYFSFITFQPSGIEPITGSVQVIKLVCKGTIEERILELQEKKKILTDALIEGEDRDKNIISSLSEKDIKNLLKLDNEN